jgi:hypothetical protein
VAREKEGIKRRVREDKRDSIRGLKDGLGRGSERGVREYLSVLLPRASICV